MRESPARSTSLCSVARSCIVWRAVPTRYQIRFTLGSTPNARALSPVHSACPSHHCIAATASCALATAGAVAASGSFKAQMEVLQRRTSAKAACRRQQSGPIGLQPTRTATAAVAKPPTQCSFHDWPAVRSIKKLAQAKPQIILQSLHCELPHPAAPTCNAP